MNTFDLLAAYSDLIVASAVLVGVLYLVFMGNKIYKHLQESEALNRAIKEREFHSRYDEQRLSIEKQIADLNLQLTQSANRFKDVNHLAISGQKKGSDFKSSIVDPEAFLDTLGLHAADLKVDKNLVFVLTPFHPSERITYSSIVDAFDNYGTRVIRGDEQSVGGDILTHIIKMMLTARLVIANVSTRNPNVMYELGIAHALGKDVVMISNTKEKMPFDVNSRRIIFYENNGDLVNQLRQELGRKLFSEL